MSPEAARRRLARVSQAIEVHVGDDAELQAQLRAIVRAASAEAVREGRRWSLAIPGGSVVARLLAGLRRQDAAWDLADLFWCDERAVPIAHADSNAGASRRGWLGALGATAMRVHPMPVDAPTLGEGAREYERALRQALGPGAVLDVAVVGVGEDGHVCSLFPGGAALEVRDALVVGVDDAPKPPPRRLTLTLPAVSGASVVVVGAFGDGKRAAMHAVLRDPASALPAARLIRAARRAVVLMDQGAAGGAAPGA